MNINIYQIPHARDKNDVKFLWYESLEQFQNTQNIDASIYDEVFSGDVDCENLEDVFRKFNTERHPLHRGHSLSVSDVVVTSKGAYYCDRIGFRQIDFAEVQAQKSDNLMRVVYVEPHMAAYVSEIEHSLEAEQNAVGGLIEPIYNGDGTILVCNEEAKLVGMEGNRRIDGDVIAGPFFVCGLTGEDFRGLTDDEVVKYRDKFAEPEEISPEEVKSSMGYMFYGEM